MKLPKIIIVLYMIALVEIIYLGYQHIGNENQISKGKPQIDSNGANPGKIAGEKTKKALSLPEQSQGRNDSESKSVLKQHQTNNRGEKPEPVKANAEKLTGTTQNHNHQKGNDKPDNQMDKKVGLRELRSLVQQMGENDPDAVKRVMDIADQTNDNAVLHKSLQGLGKVDTSDTNKVLLRAIGKKLDNSIEVVRILSYFKRSRPLEDDIIEQLFEFADSALTTPETQQVIVKKLSRSGGNYGRQKAEELRERFSIE